MLLQAIWSKYATKIEGEDEGIYYKKVYKKMLCCVNLVVAPVKTFSGKTDLHKILISEAFTVMFLTKNYC